MWYNYTGKRGCKIAIFSFILRAGEGRGGGGRGGEGGGEESGGGGGWGVGGGRRGRTEGVRKRKDINNKEELEFVASGEQNWRVKGLPSQNKTKNFQ